MDWKKLLSTKRLGKQSACEPAVLAADYAVDLYQKIRGISLP